MAQEDDVASALWAAVGLPPIAPYPPSVPPGGEVNDAATISESRRTATAASSEPAFLARTLEDGSGASDGVAVVHDDGFREEKGGRRLRGRSVEQGSSTQPLLASAGAVVVDGVAKAVVVVGGGGEEGAGVAGLEEAEGGGGGVESSVRRRLMAGDALSRAPGAVQGKALPPECRERIAVCEADSACVSELER